MALDPRYITGFSLEQYFVEKDTGAPLAGGVLSFWEDDSRTTPKLVYELSGAPPNYTYTPLPNPVILSSVGTIQDAAGNNIALYAYPFDAAGNLQLYYVTCDNSFGTEQFTREAWPFNEANGVSPSPGGAVSVYNANQLKNPQFVAVLFTPPGPYVITIGGAGSFVFNIAPEWNLNVTATGATTVTITRTSITGIAALPNNPPYTLTVTPGLNISALSLVQKIDHDPDIWSPQTIVSLNGWLNGSILLAPGSEVTMLYAPSQGPAQTILTQNNMTGVYTQFNSTIHLAPATNTDSSDVGFVNIVLQLSTSNPTTLSNVQIVGLESNIPNIAYYQTTVNMQQAALSFYYYNNLISQGSPSWLIGWDFPLNPTQFLGPTLAASAAGANTSRYVWDQTIVFQTTNSGPAISRSASGSGALRITATNASQFALVQYLSQADAREILNERNSVNVAALTSVVAGLAGTVSLWYTTDGALPSCAANNSIVATLDANGKPATFNGNWTEVPRSSLGNAQFTILPSTTTNFNDYGFSGWSLNGAAGANTATFFAIVIGFATLPIGQTIDFGSISLTPGNIPTRPAPRNGGEELRRCQIFYEKSFDLAVIPAQNLGTLSGVVSTNQVGGAQQTFPTQFFKVSKNIVGATTTTYNPSAANSLARNLTTNADCLTTTSSASQNFLFVTITPDGGSATGDTISVYWSADCRLGK